MSDDEQKPHHITINGVDLSKHVSDIKLTPDELQQIDGIIEGQSGRFVSVFYHAFDALTATERWGGHEAIGFRALAQGIALESPPAYDTSP